MDVCFIVVLSVVSIGICVSGVVDIDKVIFSIAFIAVDQLASVVVIGSSVESPRDIGDVVLGSSCSSSQERVVL